MKKVAICGVAALAIMLAAMTGMAEEAKKQKARGAEAKAATTAKRAERKEVSEADKQWREKLAAMTPEQRRVAIATKAFEDDLAPWKKVRALAVEEKATKTVAEVDKVIAAKTEQHKKRLEAMAKARPAAGRTAETPARRQQQRTEKKPAK